jgi:HK97 family phage major capsid protein
MPATIEETLEAMTAIIAASDAEQRSLTDDEVANYEQLETQLAGLRRDAEIRSRNAAYLTPNRSDVHVHVGGSAPAEDTELRAAFTRYLRGDLGAGAEFRDLNVGTPADGGYTAPDGFRVKLVERLKAFGGLANEAEEIVTETGTALPWPTVDDTSNVGEIAAEGSNGVAGADITFGTKTLGSFKYTAMGADNSGDDPIRISVELLQDSAFDIEAFVIKALATRIARKQADHWVNGVGTTQPLGITSKAATDTFDTNDAPDLADLVSIAHQLDPAYHANAKWLMNFATLGYFRGLVGTDGRPLFQDAAVASGANGFGGTILGYPVVVDQAMPSYTADNAKAIIFGDLTESYVIRRVRDLQVVVDPYTRAKYGQVEINAWLRADGTVQNDNSFVVLANITAG